MGWNHQLVIFFIFIVKIFVVVIIMDDEMCPLKSEILSDRQNSLQEIWGRKFLSEFYPIKNGWQLHPMELGFSLILTKSFLCEASAIYLHPSVLASVFDC